MNGPRIRLEVPEVPGDGEFAFVSKRNCSMSPGMVLALLGLTAAVHLGIGTAFAVLGLWMVLPFAGIEIAAVAAAFYLNGRHAGDYERLALADGRLRLDVQDGEALQTHEFNPAWVRVVVRQDTRRPVRVALRSHGREVEIGRHLDGPGRQRYAALLRERLAAAG